MFWLIWIQFLRLFQKVPLFMLHEIANSSKMSQNIMNSLCYSTPNKKKRLLGSWILSKIKSGIVHKMKSLKWPVFLHQLSLPVCYFKIIFNYPLLLEWIAVFNCFYNGVHSHWEPLLHRFHSISFQLVILWCVKRRRLRWMLIVILSPISFLLPSSHFFYFCPLKPFVM